MKYNPKLVDLAQNQKVSASEPCASHKFVTPGNQYIDTAFHYVIKEKTQDGTADPRWIPGFLNISDLGTKAVSRQVFELLIG